MAIRMAGRLIASSQWLKRDRFVRHFVLQPSPFAGKFASHGENLNRKRDGHDDDVKDSNHHHHNSSNASSITVSRPDNDLCDFLGANKLGRKFLIGNCSGKEGDYGKQQQQQLMPVESLRGKILALFFNPVIHKPPFVLPGYLIEFYNTLKLTKPDAFEMIYVVNPSVKDENLHLHNEAISTYPWLAIPANDLDWRSYLFDSYTNFGRKHCPNIVIVDTRDNKTEILVDEIGIYDDSGLSYYYPDDDYIISYGPHSFPFTYERRQQLEALVKQFGKETSIQAILGTDSRDYLIDRHSSKVPLSSLQNKDVIIYAYCHKFALDELPFVKQLEEIYNEFPNFEIVSLNLEYNGGNEDFEKKWKDHLAHVPWLHLPIGDEKIWLLRQMIAKFNPHPRIREHDPILFVKPKGESLLDPYVYKVFNYFGLEAFPFSRKAALHFVVRRLKELSFNSYVDKASRLGLDFNYLIRNNANGVTERVSLSKVLEGRGARGILLLFSSLGTCSQKRLKSLIDVYLSQDESSSSSFEVIFVSMDKDAVSFDYHFSVMPWFAFQKPLTRSECKYLAEITTTIDFHAYSHFIAFGPGQHLIQQVGLLTKSFENCEFPFVNDAESSEHVRFWLTTKLRFEQEIDDTHPPYHQWYEIWNGVEDECDIVTDAHFWSEDDQSSTDEEDESD